MGRPPDPGGRAGGAAGISRRAACAGERAELPGAAAPHWPGVLVLDREPLGEQPDGDVPAEPVVLVVSEVQDER